MFYIGRISPDIYYIWSMYILLYYHVYIMEVINVTRNRLPKIVRCAFIYFFFVSRIEK